jgi:hypothetical protein
MAVMKARNCGDIEALKTVLRFRAQARSAISEPQRQAVQLSAE